MSAKWLRFSIYTTIAVAVFGGVAFLCLIAYRNCEVGTDVAAICKLNVHIADAEAKYVIKKWPRVLLPDVRSWLVANIHGGHVSDFNLHAEIKISLTKGIQLHDLDGRFIAHDFTLQYIDNGPRITALNGVATFDTTGFYLREASGDLLGVRLREVELAIANDAHGETILQISTNLTGTAAALAAAAEAEPVRLWSSTGTSAHFARGEGTGRFVLSIALRADMSEVWPAFELTTNLRNATTTQPLWSSVLLHDATVQLHLKQEQNAKAVDGTFELNDGDTQIKGSLFIPETMEQQTLLVTITGEQFDLKSLALSAPPEASVDAGVTRSSVRSMPFKITAQNIGRVVYAGKVVVSRADVVVEQPTDRPINIDIDAWQSSKQNIWFKLEDSQLSGRCPDMGGLLASLGWNDIVTRGEMTFNGTHQAEPFQLTLAAEIDNIKVRHFPLFARILAMSSLNDIVEQLRGSNAVHFEEIKLGLKADGQKFVVQNAKAISAILGINVQEAIINADDKSIVAAGVLLPVRILSKIIANIPLVGGLVVNKEGSGLLGVNFKIDGALADPRVRINPISVLTPSIVQNLSEALHD